MRAVQTDAAAAADSEISEDEDDEMAGVKGVATSFGAAKRTDPSPARTLTPKAKSVAQVKAGQKGFMAVNGSQ